MRNVYITWNDCIVKGASYLFKTHRGAMQQSVKVTTNPKVKTVESNSDACKYYIALGDEYEEAGKRKIYAYGKSGSLLTVINL